MSLMAAPNMHNGPVLGRIIARNNSATFTSSLTWIDRDAEPFGWTCDGSPLKAV
jgi:hypothetical protein